MSTQTFLLPDVGEGLTEAEIVSWRVAPGDAVAVNDVLVEIETAKSLVELPSPFAGIVGDLLAAEGDTVNVGAAIITIAGADCLGTAGDVGPERARRTARARGRRRRCGARRLRHRRSRAVAPAQAAPTRSSGSGIRRRRRQAPDPQARPRSRRRPRRRDAQRAGRRGDARRRHEARVAGERVPQHRDAGVGCRPRGDDPRRRAGCRGIRPRPAHARAARPGRGSRGVDPGARRAQGDGHRDGAAAPTPRRTSRSGSTSTRRARWSSSSG